MTSQRLPASVAVATVTLGRRVLARLLQGLIPAILVGIAAPQLIANRTVNPTASPIYLAAMVTAGVIFLTNVVLLATSGRTLGSALLGYEYRSATGDRRGGRAVGRMLVTDLFVLVTCGIGAIVMMFTYREGTTLVDRWMTMVAVNPKLIDPARDIEAPTVRPPGTVHQVTMPGVAAPPPGTYNPHLQAGSPMPPSLAGGNMPTPSAGSNMSTPSAGGPMPTPLAGSHPPAPQPSPKPTPGVFIPGVSPSSPAPGSGLFPKPMPATNPGALIDSVPNFGPRHTPATPPTPAVSVDDRAATSTPADPVADKAATPTPAAMAEAATQQPSDETVLDASLYPDALPCIRLDDGQVITLESPVVFGRNPVAPAEYPDAQPKALNDQTMKLSKTHAVVFAEQGQVKVVDLGARNGVVLEHDGTRSKIPQGEPFPVPSGATIRTGGRFFRVAP